MSDTFLFDSNFQKLEVALQAREKMQSVYAANIANADVPNYKADTRNFNDIFRSMYHPTSGADKLVRTNGHYMDINSEPMPAIDTTSTSNNGAQRLDGNTVNIQNQMAGMAENQMMDEYTLNLISGEFQDIKSVLKGA